MSDPGRDAGVPQAAVDAAFPILHGGREFREEPALREALEGPVRAALVAAGLARGTAEREALKAVIREEAVEREQERNERERRRLELLEVTADRGRLTAEVVRLRAALAACRSATPERVTGTVAAIVREALDAP